MRNKKIFGVSELPKDEIFDTGISGFFRNRNRTFGFGKLVRNWYRNYRKCTGISKILEKSEISGIFVVFRTFPKIPVWIGQTSPNQAKNIQIKNGLKTILGHSGAEIINFLCFGPFLAHFGAIFDQFWLLFKPKFSVRFSENFRTFETARVSEFLTGTKMYRKFRFEIFGFGPVFSRKYTGLRNS